MPTTHKWASVACGHESLYAIDTLGHLWVCGYNNNGPIRIGNTINQSTLRKVTQAIESGSTPSNITFKWKFVASEHFHVFAIDAYDNLWSWGITFLGN